MTSPDPITTAHGWTDEVRQAVTALEDKYGIELISGPHHAKWVDAACYEIGGGAVRMYKDDVEKLKAERDVNDAIAQKLIDWLVEHNHFDRGEEMLVNDVKALLDDVAANYEFDAEVTRVQKDAEITRLTSQLEQAEKVIAPLYFDSTNVPFAIPDRRPLWMRDDNGKYVELLHTTVGTLRAASQWIKDRQAKGEG